MPAKSGQRNNFRSDGYLSIDDGLAKSIPTFREQQFRISVEVFNVINTNRFGIPQVAGDSPNFGVYKTGGWLQGPAALLFNPARCSSPPSTSSSPRADEDRRSSPSG